MAALLCIVVPAVGLRGLMPASRPAATVPCATSRCAPLRALLDDFNEQSSTEIAMKAAQLGRADRVLSDLDGAWVLLFNPGRKDEGVYTVQNQDAITGYVLAFERSSDADRFGQMLHAEGGFDLGTAKRWDVKRLVDFCTMGEFEVSLVPQGTLTSPDLEGKATDECVITEAGSSCITTDGLDPPPIDDERRRRSPGLQNNFYDIPTDEFKRPYGTPGAPSGSSGVSFPEFGAESFMPGRETEYEALKAEQAGAAEADRPDGLDPPPIDDERRRKSPGIARNFWDLSTEEFKRSWGTTSGGTTSDDGTRAAPASASPAPVATNYESIGLLTRVAQLERSYKRLKETLSEVIEREEAAKRDVQQANEREESLLRRIAALEARQPDEGA